MALRTITSFVSGEKLGTAGLARQNFDLEVHKTSWPPFYSTAWFLPTVAVTAVNRGREIPNGWVELQVRKFDGDITSISTLQDSWWPAGTEGRLEIRNWNTGSRRSYAPQVAGRRLPGPGTYILRVMIFERIPEAAQPNTFRIEYLLDQKILEYFRVEEFSNVLNFWIVVGTFSAVVVALLAAFIRR